MNPFDGFPTEMTCMIADWIATGEKRYQSVEKCILLEKIAKLNGTLITTRRFPFEKILYDQTTNPEQWKSLVNALNAIATASDFFLAGGFVANHVGRTTSFGDIDIFIQHHGLFEDPPQNVAGWTVGNYYNAFSQGVQRQFRVYDQTDSPFQLILVESEDPNENFENFAASILYSFDLQICQCGLMPNGKLIFVDTCMMPKTIESTLKRILKYETRITQHTVDCKPFCSTHFESAY